MHAPKNDVWWRHRWLHVFGVPYLSDLHSSVQRRAKDVQVIPCTRELGTGDGTGEAPAEPTTGFSGAEGGGTIILLLIQVIFFWKTSFAYLPSVILFICETNM